MLIAHLSGSEMRVCENPVALAMPIDSRLILKADFSEHMCIKMHDFSNVFLVQTVNE